MGVEYAVEQLTGALKVLADTDDPLQVRLQRAWDDHVQNLWISVYLPVGLNERFKEMWHRYTPPSDDRQSTVLRAMGSDELGAAVADLVQLAIDTAAAWARGEPPAPRPSKGGA